MFGNIDWIGTRLTDLAARAGMTRPSMLELVDAEEVGAARFDEACLTLQELLREGSTSIAGPNASSRGELGQARERADRRAARGDRDP